MNALLIVANIFCAFSLILQILCVALPHWFSYPSGSNEVFYGLWEYCARVASDNYVCRPYARANMTVEDWLAATAALEVLCLVLILIALVLGCLTFCFKYTILLYIVAGILALFDALSGTVALIVLGSKFGDGNSMDGDNLHASFYLALFATLFALIAGVLFIVSKPKSAVNTFEKF